jgi:hypothetical protein
MKDPHNIRKNKEWLDMMPIQLQEKWAFYTLVENSPQFLHWKLNERETFKDFIFGSFTITKTDEGILYWKDISEGRFGVIKKKKSLWYKIINFLNL